MKPDWKYSPFWAKWLAQDANGDWFWFETEPSANLRLEMWCTGPEGGRCYWARTFPLKGKWTDTKRMYRP